MILHGTQELKLRLAEAVFYAHVGSFGIEPRVPNGVKKFRIRRGVAAVGRYKHLIDLEALDDGAETAAVICVTVGADNVAEPCDAEGA